MIPIADLWNSTDAAAWEKALARYWTFVQPRNLALEQSLEALDLQRLRRLDPQGWYDFLRDEYFRWKYTQPNRYAYTKGLLRRYVVEDELAELDQIRLRLLSLDTDDIRGSLEVARSIRGLGTAGASGLLTLMYPQQFGTVDQFVVKALRQVDGLAEAPAIRRMNPESLTARDGVCIIGVLRRKAAENNRCLSSTTWTPRNVDKVLWTYGR